LVFLSGFGVEIGNQEDMSDGELARFEEEDVVNPGANPVGFYRWESEGALCAGDSHATVATEQRLRLCIQTAGVGWQKRSVERFCQALDSVLTPSSKSKFLNDGYAVGAADRASETWIRGLSKRRQLQIVGKLALSTKELQRDPPEGAHWVVGTGLVSVMDYAFSFVQQRVRANERWMFCATLFFNT